MRYAMQRSTSSRHPGSRPTHLVRAVAVLALGVLLSPTDGARAAEPSPQLAGSWRAAETADEKKERLQAIDEATRRLRAFQQSMARSRLSERTSPRPSLILEIEGPKVTIASGDRRLELELGGSPIEVSGNQGKARVSARMEGPRLIVVSRGGNGTRTTAYHADGDHLSVEVTMTGSRLAGPLEYVATYARAE